MKNSLIYLLLLLTTLNVSCSNEDFDVNDVDVRVKKLSELVEVVNMVDPLINMSRGFSSDIEEKQLILKFKSPGFYVKKEKTPQSRAFGPSIVDAEFKGFKGASAMIKQGKYQNTISIGYTNNINNNPITVRYASQKKKKLWKRRHETTYSATIEFNNNYFNAIVPLKHSKAFVNLGAPLKVLRVNATVHVHDFTSGC